MRKQKFKTFLSENFISEAYNIAIKSHSDIDSFETTLDKDFIKDLFDFLNSMGYSSVPLAGANDSKGYLKIRGVGKNSDSVDAVNKWFKDNGYSKEGKITFGEGSIGSGGGVKISESTQELMVCALLLNGVTRSGNVTVEDAVQIIDDAKVVFKKIQGVSGRGELLDQFDGNFNDLATAISSANSILQIVKNPVKVFWTGQEWGKEIAKFNPPVNNIKNYNSSDIVVKGSDGVYYGFSLKKKGSSRDVDPTLINKPITGKVGLLKNILSSSEVNKIEKSKEDFFDYVIYKHYGIKTDKLTDKQKKEKIKNITQSQMGKYLKDPRNTFFRRVETSLRNNADAFMKNFLNLIFRTDLSKIEKSGEFKFFLLTGIGKFSKGEVIVEKAVVEDIPNTIEALQNIFNSNLTLEQTKNKLNAWEKKTNAAKIFLTIYANGQPIVNIEIRYKGSYTANPQFQAVATPQFKNIFKSGKIL